MSKEVSDEYLTSNRGLFQISSKTLPSPHNGRATDDCYASHSARKQSPDRI